jgi:hypothetical protein
MNIPLDNLYHWVRSCANEPVSIYTFNPHGSKNIVDLNFLSPGDINYIIPDLICHDQEPLNFEIYENVDVVELFKQKINFQHNADVPDQINKTIEIVKSVASHYQNLNFFAVLYLLKSKIIFDRYILLHSEKNSTDVERFSHNAEPVYYWCHGIIARDWYRFAEHDPRLQKLSSRKKTFLVYCRAWTGTREYRLKFLDLLAERNLLDRCQTSILHRDQNVLLSSYVCKNSKLQPTNIDQLFSIPENNESANASADYCADDFVSTDISVVLETVAADTKIHLTEKTLRPIACGHPFMLVAGPGSLEYIRSYGFKTFSPWINENYDQEKDVVERMKMIITEMQRIEALPEEQKKYMLTQLKKITEYNKHHFFSMDFFNQIKSELTENLNIAIQQTKKTRGYHYLRKKVLTRPYSKHNLSMKQEKKLAIGKVLRQLRRDPTTNLQKIIDQYPEGFFNL